MGPLISKLDIILARIENQTEQKKILNRIGNQKSVTDSQTAQ